MERKDVDERGVAFWKPISHVVLKMRHFNFEQLSNKV